MNGQEQLWRVDTGQVPRLYTGADGWIKAQIWGMGIASHDVTGDGFPGSLPDQPGREQAPDPGRWAGDTGIPRYRPQPRAQTLLEPFTGGDPLPSTAWHAEFQDVNNDGYVDLFIAKGNVSEMQDFAQRDPSNLLLGQADGTFKGGALRRRDRRFRAGRGGALVDLNLDGLLDLVTLGYGNAVKVWRNVGSGDAGQAPDGVLARRRDRRSPGPNRDAIGGWIEVRVGDTTLRRELVVGGGHMGGQLGWVHFGIGSADAAEVRVLWPDGEAGPWLAMRRRTSSPIIERGATEARPWQPSPD